jgi:hypothetical protein
VSRQIHKTLLIFYPCRHLNKHMHNDARNDLDFGQGDRMSFWKNRPNCRPAIFFLKLIHNLYRSKNVAQNLGCFCNFRKTAQRKQSPNRRKFVQSGHPDFGKENESPTSLDLTILWKRVVKLLAPTDSRGQKTMLLPSSYMKFSTGGIYQRKLRHL